MKRLDVVFCVEPILLTVQHKRALSKPNVSVLKSSPNSIFNNFSRKRQDSVGVGACACAGACGGTLGGAGGCGCAGVGACAGARACGGTLGGAGGCGCAGAYVRMGDSDGARVPAHACTGVCACVRVGAGAHAHAGTGACACAGAGAGSCACACIGAGACAGAGPDAGACAWLHKMYNYYCGATLHIQLLLWGYIAYTTAIVGLH